MPQTYNISLPQSLASQVDDLVKNDDYSSRSELVRSALRVYLALTKQSNLPEMNIFSKKPLNQVKRDLNQTGKYSNKFTESLISGLKKSSIYAD